MIILWILLLLLWFVLAILYFISWRTWKQQDNLRRAERQGRR